jgi:hypothetical protein
VSEPVLLGLTNGFSHGRGFTAPVSVATPAAGADWSYTITGSYWIRLAALSFQFVSSSATANRVPTLQILDEGGVILAAIPPAAAQTASHTYTYTFLPNVGVVGSIDANVAVAPLPSFFLRPGYKVVTVTSAIDTGDQYSNIRMIAEQIDTGPAGYPIGVFEESELAQFLERYA